jgi:hypothetical protein
MDGHHRHRRLWQATAQPLSRRHHVLALEAVGVLLRLPHVDHAPAPWFHDLRHAAASLLIAPGVPVKVVSDILGHSRLATTDICSHLYPAAHKDATDPMDRILYPGNGRGTGSCADCGQDCGQETPRPGRLSRPGLDFWLREAVFRGLGSRDSNPNYLIQSQASYR